MSDDQLPPIGDMEVESLRAYLHRVADWSADYRRDVVKLPISPDVQPGDTARKLPARMPMEGESVDVILDDIDRIVMPGIVHWGHPAFLGYFGSTSNAPALLGELAAAALNTSSMTWRTSPATTELEGRVLEWLAELVGIPAKFFGVVYDTASVGVVHALAAARERVAPDIRTLGIAGRADIGTLRVYASDQAHSSLEKAMIMLGIGERNVVRVESDAAFRMNCDALRASIQRDVDAGMRPFAVVATVGTTSTAAVDPVREISAVCREYGAWLHVDGAYGVAIGALPEGRWALDGVELADSVVVNPHKWLFVPLDYSVLYMRDGEALRSLFSLVPEYLRGDAGGATVDYMDYGIQLGRRFRSLKAWVVFRALGAEGIRRRLREHLRLAAEFAQWVEDDPSFELSAPVTMGVVAFRYIGAASGVEGDRANVAIVERVNASGAAYITHTRLRGRVAIRVGFGNIATTEADVRGVWDRIRKAADE